MSGAAFVAEAVAVFVDAVAADLPGSGMNGRVVVAAVQAPDGPVAVLVDAGPAGAAGQPAGHVVGPVLDALPLERHGGLEGGHRRGARLVRVGLHAGGDLRGRRVDPRLNVGDVP